MKRLVPVERNSKMDIEALLFKIDHEQKASQKKLMKSATLKRNLSNEMVPQDEFDDLPDPSEHPCARLSQKQKMEENYLKSELLKSWDMLYKIAVEKKRRKIILSKDEYSVDYDVVNRRELLLPPEFYLNMAKLEKNYMDNHYNQGYNLPVSRLRMYLSRRFSIKHDLIHLNCISKWLNVSQVDLLRKRLKPVQNKLLNRVKKKLRMKKSRVSVFVKAKPKMLSAKEAANLPSFGGKARDQAVKKFIKGPDDGGSPKSNDDEKASFMSDLNDYPRVSILDIINWANEKTQDLNEVFKMYSKKDKEGQYFMNIHDFKSFMSVFLELKLTQINKRSIFNVLDLNKDGYISQDQFVKNFALTSEDIEQAIESPQEFKNGRILEMVIEQIYHAAIYFKKTSITEIYQKLNRNGEISIKRLEQQLSFYKVTLTDDERVMLSNTSMEVDRNGDKLVPFRKLVSTSISNSNTNIDFRLKLQKQGTMTKRDKSARLRQMEQQIEQEAILKEQERLKKLELMNARKDDSEFSQFEDSDRASSAMRKTRSKFAKSPQKQKEVVKDQFGQKFLELFQKSLVEVMQKNGSISENYSGPDFAQYKPYRSVINSKIGLPQFLVYSNGTIDGSINLNKHSSNHEIRTIYEYDKHSTLQSNIDGYRYDNKWISRRQFNNYDTPQKYWPNGRPRGSLERFSNKNSKYVRLANQGLYTGIQGTSIKRNSRMPFSHGSSRQAEHKSANQASRQPMNSDQLLLTIEKLSHKFGTPFKLDGHKEQFVQYLRENQSLREKLLDFQEKTNRSHVSLPQNEDKEFNLKVSWLHIF